MGDRKRVVKNIEFSKKRMGVGNPFYGHKHSPEAIEKMKERRALQSPPVPKGSKFSIESSIKKSIASIGKKKSPESVEKMRRSLTGRKLSDKHKNKIGEGIIKSKKYREGRLKLIGIRHSEEHKRKISSSLKLAYATGKKIPTYPAQKISKPHRLFIHLFEQEFGIKLKKEFRINDGVRSRFYDCHIPGTNILVEVDGTYWHSRPHQIKIDAEKNILAQKNGFVLIRVWETDVEKFIYSLKLLQNILLKAA